MFGSVFTHYEGPWQSVHFQTFKKQAHNSSLSSLAVCLLTEGKLDVTKAGLKLLTIEPEGMFGELALLYSCTHTYSVSGIKALCRDMQISHISIATKHLWSLTVIPVD